MSKEDHDALQGVPRPAVDTRTLQEVDNPLVHTNTVDLDKFHSFSYASNPTDPDAPTLCEAMYVPYREGFVYAMDDDIDALQKSKNGLSLPDNNF